MIYFSYFFEVGLHHLVETLTKCTTKHYLRTLVKCTTVLSNAGKNVKTFSGNLAKCTTDLLKCCYKKELVKKMQKCSLITRMERERSRNTYIDGELTKYPDTSCTTILQDELSAIRNL